MRSPAVTDRADLAACLLEAGIPVVLCGPDPAPAPAGRVALFVGDVGEAAVEMAHELFGGVPVVVHTAAQAQEMIADLRRFPEAGSSTLDSLP